MVSAPTTKAHFAAPDFTYLSATLSAKIKPEQAACTSNAAPPFLIPKRPCNKDAVLGKIKSGVDVPNTIKSTSSGDLPAISKARRAAISAKSQADCPSTTWR